MAKKKSANKPGHQARKRFGQNFLHDPGIINRIITSIQPRPGDRMVEIGPGLGALTEPLLQANEGRLDVVELDRDLIPVLRTKFFNYPEFVIHEADALKFDFRQLLNADERLRIVGNLPYNISTPLIFHLLEHVGQIADMHFMLQKEVVERLGAVTGDSHYGRLGIMAQYYCRVQPLFVVSPGAFKPAPKVDSAIVRLMPYENLPYPARSVDNLAKVVKAAFSQRRKTLRNSLSSLFDETQLKSVDIDPGLRPENLSIEEYVRISDLLLDASE